MPYVYYYSTKLIPTKLKNAGKNVDILFFPILMTAWPIGFHPGAF